MADRAAKRPKAARDSAEHGFRSSRRSAEHGFRSSRRSAEHGFTLIEITVALAVFSLAVLALVRLESGTLRGIAAVDGAMAADLVARSVAEDAVSSASPPALGTATGREANGGRAWQWTRTVAPTGNTAVLKIDVVVQDGTGVVRGRAILVRPPPPAPPLPSPAP